MSKWLLCILALCVGVALCGCGTPSKPIPVAVPAQHQFGMAHWKLNRTRWASIHAVYDNLVCDANGKVIASIQGGGDDMYSTFGGDGNGHGDFATWEQARARAEMLQGESYNNEYWRGWKLNQCP
jgi:hypothetical protein